MRPLELSLSGLHSYREPVTIDFQELGRYGLFGIFGRIGSGKSTLLDAITLALFGLVDRTATRSRKGLLHPAAERCEVRFRFAIEAPGAGGQPLEVYEVHRSYREVDGVAQRVGARLLRLGGEGGPRVVITDKETETNQAVSEIVGLGPEDFMRAVVLPQGRFQQLLHLKGSERRQMLQRIFKLQAYGEGLRRQVRDRHDSTRSALASVRGELLGIGDASAPAVETARTARAAAAAEARATEAALEVARTAHDAALRAREQVERRTDAAAALHDHLRSSVDHEQRRATLDGAERLRPLVGPAARWRDAVARCAVAEAALATANAEAELTGREVAEGTAALERARAEARTRGPEVRERIARLEQVVRWQAERTGEEERRAEARAIEHDASEALVAAEQAEQAARGRRSSFETARRQAKREHAKCRVSAEQREAVGKAVRAADRVAATQRQVEESAAAQRAAAAEVDRATAALAAADAELDTLQRAAQLARAVAHDAEGAHDRLGDEDRERLRRELAACDQAIALTASRRAALEAAEAAMAAAVQRRREAEADAELARSARSAAGEVLRGAERAVREAERALELATARATAADLARGLRPSTPCPVCGAPEHPAPAVPPAEPLPLPAVEAHRAGRDKAVQRHEAAVEHDARASAAAEAARTAEREAAERRVQAAAEAGSDLDVHGRRAEVLATLERAEVADHRWRTALTAAGAAAAAAERAMSPRAVAAAALDAAQDATRRAASAHTARTAAADEAWAAFDRDRGEHTLFDVAAAATALETRDRQAEALDQRIDALDAEIAQARQAEDAARAESDRHRTELARLRERLEEAAARIAHLGARISAEPLEGSPAEALAAARDAYDGLTAAIDAADAALVRASASHALVVRRRDAAEAEHRGARAEREAADRALGEVEASSGAPWRDLGPEGRGAGVQALLADPPNDGRIALLRQQVSAWEGARVALQAKLDALSDGEVVVTEEAWTQIADRFVRCTERADAAREAAIAAAQLFVSLEARAPRFQALVTQESALDQELGRLDELGTLLRGDRFVEFVANDHLADLTERATRHLQTLTHGRYRLQLDDELAFVVQDEDSGGALRPVHSLSGGESFLTALALALALSAQVQQRSARPLGFFFLDEGFGTLDPDALDRVMTAIEGLRSEDRLIGLISHVPAVRERVPRYLWVHPASGNQGSKVEMRDT